MFLLLALLIEEKKKMMMMISVCAVVSLRLVGLEWRCETGFPGFLDDIGRGGGNDAGTGVSMIGRVESCWVLCSRRWEFGRGLKEGRM